VVSESTQSEEKGDAQPTEPPQDVRARLRKLERLEFKYGELLRSYRIAHARVTSIEAFEGALREITPLTSINDPGALSEYLNQLNLKGDMVLDELKRVSNERHGLRYRKRLLRRTTRKGRMQKASSLRTLANMMTRPGRRR